MSIISLDTTFDKRAECPNLCGDLLLDEMEKLKMAQEAAKENLSIGLKDCTCRQCQQQVIVRLIFNRNALGHYREKIMRNYRLQDKNFKNCKNQFCRL